MPFILILICEYWWKCYVLCSTNLRKLAAQQPDLGGGAPQFAVAKGYNILQVTTRLFAPVWSPQFVVAWLGVARAGRQTKVTQ